MENKKYTIIEKEDIAEIHFGDIAFGACRYTTENGDFVNVWCLTPEEGCESSGLEFHEAKGAPYTAKEIAEVLAGDPAEFRRICSNYDLSMDVCMDEYAAKAAEGVCGYYYRCMSDAFGRMYADWAENPFECWEVDETPVRQAYIASLMK